MEILLIFLLIIAILAVGTYIVMGSLIAVLIAILASVITLSVCTLIGFLFKKWVQYHSRK